jgi:predicted nucleic acid-binding protein
MHAADAEQYLNTVFRPLFAVQSSQTLYAQALRLHVQSGLSWNDSLIVSSAIQARCDLLLTEDLRHDQRFGTLKVQNPFL